MRKLVYNTSSEMLKLAIERISLEFSSLCHTPDKALKLYLKTFEALPLPRVIFDESKSNFTPPKMNEFYKEIKKY